MGGLIAAVQLTASLIWTGWDTSPQHTAIACALASAALAAGVAWSRNTVFSRTFAPLLIALSIFAGFEAPSSEHALL